MPAERSKGRFAAPPDPVRADLKSNAPMTPTPARMRRALERFAADYDQDPHIPQARKDAVQKALADKEFEAAESAANEQWVHNFDRFLLGRYQPNTDDLAEDPTVSGRVPYGRLDETRRTFLNTPGVRKYLHDKMNRRADFEAYLELLRKFGPVSPTGGNPDIRHVYIFYKYILHGSVVDDDHFLADYDFGMGAPDPTQPPPEDFMRMFPRDARSFFNQGGFQPDEHDAPADRKAKESREPPDPTSRQNITTMAQYASGRHAQQAPDATNASAYANRTRAAAPAPVPPAPVPPPINNNNNNNNSNSPGTGQPGGSDQDIIDAYLSFIRQKKTEYDADVFTPLKAAEARNEPQAVLDGLRQRAYHQTPYAQINEIESRVDAAAVVMADPASKASDRTRVIDDVKSQLRHAIDKYKTAFGASFTDPALAGKGKLSVDNLVQGMTIMLIEHKMHHQIDSDAVKTALDPKGKKAKHFVDFVYQKLVELVEDMDQHRPERYHEAMIETYRRRSHPGALRVPAPEWARIEQVLKKRFLPKNP